MKSNYQRNDDSYFLLDKVKENILAFDILLMIAMIMKSSYSITDKNKIYILPDYKCNHVKTTVSDLKDEDFAKAAKISMINLFGYG